MGLTDRDIRRAELDIRDPQWYRRSSKAAREVVYGRMDAARRAEKRRERRRAYRRGERPRSGCATALAVLVIGMVSLLALSIVFYSVM